MRSSASSRPSASGANSSPPRNEAPFSLVSYADTQVKVSGRAIFRYMQGALESERMPLPPVELAPADRMVLLDWLRKGASPGAKNRVCAVAQDGGSTDAEGRDVVTDAKSEGAELDADAVPDASYPPSDAMDDSDAEDGAEEEDGGDGGEDA